MDIYGQMQGAMAEVATRRAVRDVLALDVKRINAEVALMHGGLFTEARIAKDDATLAEETARALVRAHYEVTGETKPVTGVTVKQMTRCQYDPALALAWARDKRMALVPEALNATAFEAIMAATSEADRPAWVTFGVTPQVQLATDLSVYLSAYLIDPTPTETAA